MGKPPAEPQLYPSIAISDAVNAAGHALAAHMLWSSERLAALGFLIVALAASVGVLRFGFDERTFTQANSDLAELSAFVGLPLVGAAFAQRSGLVGRGGDASIVVGCVITCVLARSLARGTKELAKILLNLVLFLMPVAYHSYTSNDKRTGAAIAAFAVAGIVIGSDHDRLLFGVRRVNIFHYAIGACSYSIAFGLA